MANADVDTLTPAQMVLQNIDKQLKAIRTDLKRLEVGQDALAETVGEISDTLEEFLGGDPGE